MTRDEIIKEVSKFFDIRELVSENVYKKFGVSAWKVFDTDLLNTILVLRRDILKVPLICNNWKNGGQLSQRGFRENTCQIVSEKTKGGVTYISAHSIGKGIDLSSGKMSADDMRKKIAANAKLLPCNVRIESAKLAPTWLHIDTMVAPDVTAKVSWF